MNLQNQFWIFFRFGEFITWNSGSSMKSRSWSNVSCGILSFLKNSMSWKKLLLNNKSFAASQLKIERTCDVTRMYENEARNSKWERTFVRRRREGTQLSWRGRHLSADKWTIELRRSRRCREKREPRERRSKSGWLYRTPSELPSASLRSGPSFSRCEPPPPCSDPEPGVIHKIRKQETKRLDSPETGMVLTSMYCFRFLSQLCFSLRASNCAWRFLGRRSATCFLYSAILLCASSMRANPAW